KRTPTWRVRSKGPATAVKPGCAAIGPPPTDQLVTRSVSFERTRRQLGTPVTGGAGWSKPAKRAPLWSAGRMPTERQTEASARTRIAGRILAPVLWPARRMVVEEEAARAVHELRLTENVGARRDGEPHPTTGR